MRFMVWNTEMQKYECSHCSWKQAILADCSDPAEKLELEFQTHRCEEYLQKAAA
jgi:hypothetical protein